MLPFQRRPYTVEITAAAAGRVRMSDGLEVIAQRACEDIDRADALLINGGSAFAVRRQCAAPGMAEASVGARRSHRFGLHGTMVLAAAAF